LGRSLAAEIIDISSDSGTRVRKEVEIIEVEIIEISSDSDSKVVRWPQARQDH
jgi:hypothetical protein